MPFKYPSLLAVDAFRLTGYLISKPLWFVTYTGRENIPDPTIGGLIVAANHQTYIDPVWIVLPMRRRLRFMAFDKAFGWPVVGKLIRYLGAFPVAHDGSGAVGSIKESLRSLRQGAALVVFPEGGREYADGAPLEFRPGVVHIAMQANVPILPVTISGGNRIWPRTQKYPSIFRRVEITFHPLLHVPTDADTIYWKAELKRIITQP